jgi:hypothetical protein
MPILTRRRSDNDHQETWHVYYGDVHVGTIGERAGFPIDEDQWHWRCGFYPGCDPGEFSDGTAPDFFTARRGFETAWRKLSAKKTESDYEEWRNQRYASWTCGEKPPPSSSIMRCVCGEQFDSWKPAESYNHRAHIYAAQAERSTSLPTRV